ncbi:hypothetical protein OG871_08845 [Kitasatospora sp. NBC_00374]|uniref:hypothetical protein n=1 Tax=Kitasatospora sp. NBC_00374 TaxID=2975964 RepID=UPI0030E5D8C0
MNRRPAVRGARSSLVSVALTAATAALLSGGCGGPSGPAREPIREITAGEQALLARTEALLVSRCMQQHGFRYDAPPAAEPAVREFRYVVDDVAWAREHGYGTRDRRRLAEAADASPVQQYFKSLPPERQQAARAALHGERPTGLSVTLPGGARLTSSDSSCTAEAQRLLYRDLPRWFEARTVVANLAPLYGSQVEQDSRFTAAAAQWAACMADAGHPYPTPGAIQNALPELTAGLAPSQADALEVELATAEAECATRTGLAATARELDGFYGNQVRERYRAELDSRLRLQLEALSRVDSLTEPTS